jgi:predicted lipoprotein with Yx(FWY)xxD motif
MIPETLRNLPDILPKRLRFTPVVRAPPTRRKLETFMRFALSAAMLAIAGLSATAALATAPSFGTTAKGPALVDAKGMTLYTFDKDASGTSNCKGGCATSWPPAAAAASDAASGDFTIITREDGAAQWAHKGKPLYTWIQDRKAGDATGGAVPGWKIATP